MYPPSNDHSFVDLLCPITRKEYNRRRTVRQWSTVAHTRVQEVSNATDMRDLNPETRRRDTTAETKEDYDREPVQQSQSALLAKLSMPFVSVIDCHVRYFG